MKRHLFFLPLFYIFFLLFISFSVSKALFADAATANANTFTAASEFPTGTLGATPTETLTGTPTTTPTGTITETPTPTPDIANHLVISEIQISGGTGNTANDFVEIYNPTNSVIDLNNWKIRKRTSSGTESSLVSFSSGNTIQAHGFFLWANSDSGFSASISANVSNGNTLAGDNSIALEMPDNSIVDQVAWGTGTSQFIEGSAFTPNPGGSQSIERKAHSTSDLSSMTSGGDVNKGNGFDGNNNSSDFILRSSSQPQNSGSTVENP